MATKGKIFVCGEITCAAKINIRSVVREVLRKVGYNPMKFIVFVYVHRQSPDIAGGVDSALEVRNSGSEDVFASTGAGDQGTVYGYATRETWTRLPVPVVFANEICKGLDDAMHDGTIRGIGPDGKAQVTVAYEDGKPVGAKNIVVSVPARCGQGSGGASPGDHLGSCCIPFWTASTSPRMWRFSSTPPAGLWRAVPPPTPGLTGRKLMVDTYGGLSAMAAAPSPERPHQGGPQRRIHGQSHRPRTWWARGWRKNARCPSPMPSARRGTHRCGNRHLWHRQGRRGCNSAGSFGCIRSAARCHHAPCSISALPSMLIPPPTATSTATSTAGRTSTRPMNCGRRWKSMLIERKHTADLIPADYNPRKDLKPGDPEYDKLKRSMEQFGYVEPGNLEQGHRTGGGRSSAAEGAHGYGRPPRWSAWWWSWMKSGKKPSTSPSTKSSGDWDKDKLMLLISDLQGADFDVSLTGFDPAEIDDLFKDSLKDGVKDDEFDVDAELQKPTITKARGCVDAGTAPACLRGQHQAGDLRPTDGRLKGQPGHHRPALQCQL